MKLDLVMDTLRSTGPEGADSLRLQEHLQALHALLGEDLIRVESALPEALEGTVSPLAETGRHLIAAGGKRIRPVLVLLSAQAVGVQESSIAIDLATAGELVHLATLLHDDVIDDAPTRRNVPTPRRIWNNTASVLGGDYALTRALDLVGTAPTSAPLREAIATLRALVEGEILQAHIRQTLSLRREDYNDVIERKTASLFRWCCRAGAHLGEVPESTEALGTYGGHLGIAFQMVDDVLDYDASQETLGKELLGDLREGKPTLPLLIALERDPEIVIPLRALTTSDAGEDDDRLLVQLRARIESTGAIHAARSEARQQAELAMDALHPLERVPATLALEEIARALVHRLQ